MKRKFLSILLTLAMALTLLPTAAMAEGASYDCEGGTDCHHKVAKINDDPRYDDVVAHFDTLEEAIRLGQMETPPTFKLLDDLTEDVVVPAGKNIYLDLNGHKLTNASGHTITVEKGGKLNISDSVGTGVVDNTSHGKGAIVNSGEVTLNGGTFKRSAEKGTYSPYGNGGNSWYTIANYGTMEINTGVTVENAGGYSSMIRNGGDATADCDLTIMGGNFAGGINTVKNDSFGVLTINGGNFSNTAQYVIMNWNKAEITAGTFQTLDTASAVLFTSSYGADANTIGKLSISGGEFKHASDTQEMIVDRYDASNSGTAAVTGGRFDADISKYIPSDYVQSADGTVEKLGETNAVAKVGDTYYKTLTDAVKAADNATVTLLKDVTEDVTIPAGKTITLDLNGKTLTNVKDHTILNNGNLTIAGTGKVDNISHAKGALYNKGTVVVNGGTFDRSKENGKNKGESGQNSWYTIKNVGTMTINDGAIVQTAGNNASLGKFSSLVSNGYFNAGDYTNNKGLDQPILTIDGGMFRGGLNTIKNDDRAKLTINGGTFSNYYQAVVQNHNIAEITGGTFTAASDANAETYGIYNCGCGAEIDLGTLTVSGGTFTGATYAVAEVSSQNAAVNISGGQFAGTKAAIVKSSTSNATIAISGGLFSSDPSAYVAAGHYVDASNNGDYPYTVKEGTKPAGALIVVKDKTEPTVSGDITGTDKTAINNVIGNANVDGVAEAAKKADIVAKSGATVAENDKVEIEVAVKVEAKAADLAKGQLTFEASPVATVKVNGTVKGTVPVSNGMLNNNPITVKLPLPTVDGKLFTPKQILHKFTGGGYEYFINESVGGMRGAGSFKIEDNCAVFTIYGFSTFELSGTVTYVVPSSGGGSSSSSRRYDVSAPSVKHGDVTVSPKNASKGDTVTITVKPDSGYELDTLTVKDASGSKIKVKDKGDGKFTFTMPASKVTVSAEFAEIETLDFADVSTDAYYYEAVKWAAKKGITGGTGDGTFNPNGSCTRAHIVTFLWRAAGSPEPKSTVSFADVPADSYYAKAVAWAVENGITLGTGDGTFSPNATCTRAQSVTFLYRALGTAPTTVNGFTDVTADAFYADAVAWAVESGVTNGTSASTFSPNNGCTRAQIVTFLYRTMK
ncbi:S-layer homology domain-containing protein [Dysosmobacter sp.]|jgi:hypothetical protein|uniref:S-layer homology domain-containing protein n=1 Tax=Dysosmobacter sp. TaxID=2591382 RepID=UPI003AB75449